MSYQIDQSGKIENTAKKTVLAWSNDTCGAVILSAKNKRRLQESFRAIGAPRLFIEYVFAALLVMLLKSCPATLVTIDLEYPKSNKIIESLIKPFITSMIRWKSIGKQSRAHDIAYKVYRGKLNIGSSISGEEVWKIVKISGVFLKEKTGGRLKIGLSPTNRRSAPASVKSLTKAFFKVKQKKDRVSAD